jgi:4-carboxymuconolactone decarboxylase
MSELDVLDPPTRRLVRLAAEIARGDEDRLVAEFEACRRDGVSSTWVEELLLQTHLMCGFPRMLTGFVLYRRVFGGASTEPSADPSRWEEWRQRGEAVCANVYTGHYAALRRNIHALHPAVEEWMLVDGYGKVLGRSGLDLVRRELCVIAQVAPMRAPRQLRSHLRGALPGDHTSVHDRRTVA